MRVKRKRTTLASVWATARTPAAGSCTVRSIARLSVNIFLRVSAGYAGQSTGGPAAPSPPAAEPTSRGTPARGAREGLRPPTMGHPLAPLPGTANGASQQDSPQRRRSVRRPSAKRAPSRGSGIGGREDAHVALPGGRARPFGHPPRGVVEAGTSAPRRLQLAALRQQGFKEPVQTRVAGAGGATAPHHPSHPWHGAVRQHLPRLPARPAAGDATAPPGPTRAAGSHALPLPS